jgi:hypothetical protein
MTSEESFHDRIEDELAGLHPPPIGEIAGAALAQGRRIRRRERTLGMAGGTAAVAGVAAGVVALSGGFASGGGAASVAPGGFVRTAPTSQNSPTPIAASTPTPTPSPTAAQTSTPAPPPDSSSPNTVIGTIPASWKPPATGGHLSDPRNTDGPSVAELLIDNLALVGPGGSGSGFSGGSMAGVNANATLTWTTQQGSIRISASVSDGSADGKTPQSQCYPAFEVDYCAAGAMSDGSVVMVEHSSGGSQSGSSPSTHNNMVMITRPDHAAINVVEWSNGPLSDDQLYKIVSDPRWGLRMDGSFVAHADKVVRPFSGG